MLWIQLLKFYIYEMRLFFYWILFIVIVSGYGCKKVDPIDLSGQLLLSQKIPTPLSNKKLEVYQSGSSSGIGIPSSSTSSSATTVTDAQGFFHFRFKPGKTTFLIFSGANATPLTLSNALDDTTFPRFTRMNFSPSELKTTKPIFVGKIIEEVTIKVHLLTDIAATDTIGLEGYTINGRISKEYSGFEAIAGSVISLDIIPNMLFTDYDYYDNQFLNNIHAGRKLKTNSGNDFISSAGALVPARLSAVDETTKEILFYFRK